MGTIQRKTLKEVDRDVLLRTVLCMGTYTCDELVSGQRKAR